MSAHVDSTTVLTCDGCRANLASSLNVHDTRLLAKTKGWTRRHHEDRQVDLCPVCTDTFQCTPFAAIGRPVSRNSGATCSTGSSN